jgi:hypothetical protein
MGLMQGQADFWGGGRQLIDLSFDYLGTISITNTKQC